MSGYFEPGFNYDPALMEPHGFHPATTPYYYDYGTPVTTIWQVLTEYASARGFGTA